MTTTQRNIAPAVEQVAMMTGLWTQKQKKKRRSFWPRSIWCVPCKIAGGITTPFGIKHIVFGHIDLNYLKKQYIKTRTNASGLACRDGLQFAFSLKLRENGFKQIFFFFNQTSLHQSLSTEMLFSHEPISTYNCQTVQ